MASLKDTLISGSLRATDTIYTDTIQLTKILAPSSSNGTTYTAGSNGYVLKSNGTSMYWASDNNTTALTSMTGTLGIDHGGTGAVTAENAAWNILHSADPGNLNTAKRLGIFKISSTTTNTPASSMWGVALNLTDLAAGNNGANGTTYQLVFKSSSTDMWLRTITNSASWSDYAKIYTDKNFNGSSEKLTDIALTWSSSYTTGNWMLIYNGENGTNGGRLFRCINQTNTAAWVDGAHKWVRIGGDTLTGTLNTQLLRPDGQYTRDLGDSSHIWRRAFIGTGGGRIEIGDLQISQSDYLIDDYFTSTSSDKGVMLFTNYNTKATPFANKLAAVPIEAITVRYTRNGGTSWTTWTESDTSGYINRDRILNSFNVSNAILPVGNVSSIDSGTANTPIDNTGVGSGIELTIDFGVENRNGYVDILTTYLLYYGRTVTYKVEIYQAHRNTWVTLINDTLVNSERWNISYLKKGFYMEARQDRDSVGGRYSAQKIRYTLLVTAIDTTVANVRYTPRLGGFYANGPGATGISSGLQVNRNNTSGVAEKVDYVSGTNFGLTLSKYNTIWQHTGNPVQHYTNGPVRPQGNVRITPARIQLTDEYNIFDAGQASYVDVTIGNNKSVDARNTHQEGRIFIYSGGTHYHAIYSKKTTTHYYHTLPNVSGNFAMGPDSGRGSTTKPVYLDSTGMLQECTYSLGTMAQETATNYLKLTGGTLTGALNFPSATLNKMGDDAYIGDVNVAGHLGVKGINGNTGIHFVTYNQSTNTVGGKITWDGTKFTITSTTAIDASISGSAGSLSTTPTLAVSGNNITVTAGGKTSAAFTVPYASSTSITLNGASASSSTGFYAPTAVGASGQVLKSNGSGAPSWTSSITLGTSGNAINITTSGTNAVTLTASSTGGWVWN